MCITPEVSTPENIVRYRLRNGTTAVIIDDLRGYLDVIANKSWIDKVPYVGFVLDKEGDLSSFQTWDMQGSFMPSLNNYHEMDIVSVYDECSSDKQAITAELDVIRKQIEELKERINR